MTREGSAFVAAEARETREDYLKVTRQTRAAGECPNYDNESFVLCVYVNSSLFVLLIFLSFLLSSWHCKVACLVAYSFLHLLICLLSFWNASERGSDFVKVSIELGYMLKHGAGQRARGRSNRECYMAKLRREWRGCFLRIETQLPARRHREKTRQF